MSFLDGTSTVKNPLHFLSVNHHPCTSCSLSSDVPRISPDAITTPAAIHASVSMLLPFLSFVLMRNRKNHPNNNYLGNMTFKSACPGIKHGRHLHSLKIVEIFHIVLIWNIRAFTTGLSCLSLYHRNWPRCLRRCFFLSSLRSVLAYGCCCVTSSFGFLGFGLAFVGLFPFSWVLGLLGCHWATSLMIGDASLFGVHSLSLTAIVSTFQVLAFFCLFLRIVT